jgi:hypothetical protein
MRKKAPSVETNTAGGQDDDRTGKTPGRGDSQETGGKAVSEWSGGGDLPRTHRGGPPRGGSYRNKGLRDNRRFGVRKGVARVAAGMRRETWWSPVRRSVGFGMNEGAAGGSWPGERE